MPFSTSIANQFMSTGSTSMSAGCLSLSNGSQLMSNGSPLMSNGSPLMSNGSPYKRRRETEVESQATHDEDNPFTKRNFERQKIVKQTTEVENEIVRVG